MFGKLMNLRNRIGRAKPKGRATHNRYRPRLKAFEDRVLLTVWTWDIPTSGNWNNAANWLSTADNTTHGIPVSGDTANLPGGGLTVTVSDAQAVGKIYAAGIANDGILEIANGGSLSIDAGSSGDSAGVLKVDLGGTLTFGAGDQYGTGNPGGNIDGTLDVGANASISLENAKVSGTITAAAGSQVAFGAGNSLIAAAPGAALDGPGQYIIPTGGTLSAQTDLSVQNLTLAGGTLTGTNNVTVTVSMTDQGGSLGDTTGGAGGTLTIAPGASMSITGSTGIDSFSLDNFGTVTYSGSGGMGAVSDGGAIFNNESGGIINVDDPTALFGSGFSLAGTFNNLAGGTLVNNITAGTTTTCFGTFNNAGTVEVTNGELLAVNGGTQSGAFQVASGAEMSFNGGQAWNTGISFTGVSGIGTGTFHVGASGNTGNTTTTVTTSVTLPDLTIDSGNDVSLATATTLTVTGGLNLGSTTDVSAGIVDGSGDVVIPSGGTLDLLDGTLATSGVTTIQPGAVMNMGGGSAIGLTTGTLNNDGTVNWTGAANFGITGNGIFNNLSDGTFNDAYNAGSHNLAGDGTSLFSNAGVYNKSSANTPGETDILTMLFNNSNTGTVNVNSGALELQNGTNYGKLNTASGATLKLFGYSFYTTSNYYLDAGTTFTGTGNVVVGGGDVTLNAAITAANFDLQQGQGGTLIANAPLTVTKNFTWDGGAISGTAPVTLAKTGTLTITEASTPTLDSGSTLDLLGKTFWEGNGTFQNLGTINNEGGAAMTIEGNETLSGSGTFNNGGSLTSSGSGTTSLGGTFNDAYHAVAGTVTVKEDTLDFTGTVGQVNAGTLAAGKWIVDGNTSLSGTLDFTAYDSTPLTTIGRPASVTLSGPNSLLGTALAGLTTNQGSFSLLAGASFTTAGNFSNTGTLTLAPVTAGATLSVNGDFSTTGVLTIDLAGTSSKPTYGTVSASGNITLGGTLKLGGSVKPSVGSAMNILLAGSSGTISGAFSDMTLSYNGMQFSVSVAGGDVVLKRTA